MAPVDRHGIIAGLCAAQGGGALPDGYEVVFDLGQSAFRFWWVLAVLGVAACGAAIRKLILASRSPPGMSPDPARIPPGRLLAITAVVTATLVYFSASRFLHLRYAMADGTAHVIEGRVSQYREMALKSGMGEQFCVEQTCFSYSSRIDKGGFHQTASNGGPIRPGLPVRVTYVDLSPDYVPNRVIIKLEVGTDTGR